MIRINETFKVKTLFPCEYILRYESAYEHDPVWRQTVIGCMVLNFLQKMFHFNVTYSEESSSNLTAAQQREALFPRANDTVDIYVKPMELQADILDFAYPIQAIFMWRFGFILRRWRGGFFRALYSQPFSGSVWFCIHSMIVLGSVLLYILSHWDNRLFGVECSFHHELLFAFSAYCQHILPLHAVSSSRRIAYISFIVCAYVVHSFYTSNLLSHLVSDKDDIIDLHTIVNDNYQIVLIKDMNLSTDKKKYEKSMDKNLSIVWERVKKLKMLDLSSSLKAVISSKTALITDYITLYPSLRKHHKIDEICQLVEVELYSNVKHYLMTSKNFPYKEEFKIGTLRAKEVGLFRRLLTLDTFKPILCKETINHYTVSAEQTLAPLIILISSYFIALFILFLERLHFDRNRVWPYIN